MKSVFKMFSLFCMGGVLYFMLEMLFRGRSHWTMAVVGGISFLICGGLNEWFTFDMPLCLQGAVCAVMVTIVEFGAGCILNLWLRLDIWDYSNMPFNLCGQICLPFTMLWFFIGMLAVIMDDYLRYLLFNEERPEYRIL